MDEYGVMDGVHYVVVPTSAAGISHVVADVEAPGGEKWEHLKKSAGKAMASYP